MKKTKIIYSLSSRGIYSELFNLCLAIIYAHHHQLSLKLNTWLWNSRIKKGWQDYFEPTLDCSNDPFSAQDKVYTNEKPWIGKIYYNPKVFFSFYFRLILNHIHCILHPSHILTKEIFNKMRSKEFVYDIIGDKAFNLMALSFKRIYILNKYTKKQIKQRMVDLDLPNDYIGVHIRRGDKITSKEMQEIRLDDYVNIIKKNKVISSNVYIATDDSSIIKVMKKKLEPFGFNIFFNNQNKSVGFNEADYNNFSTEAKREETLNVLFDMEVLTHSNFFIGTYTSNLSRVVPFFIGLEKCYSLDNDWNIINSLNGL